MVTEGAAICAYLADAFPDAGLAPPAGSRLRGPYYRWLFFAAGPVEAAITNRALKVEPNAEQQRFVGYGSFDATIDNLENALRPGPYICGDQFTAADVYVGSQIGFGMMFGSVEKRPIFEEYFGRLQARPAAARAREKDDALIAAQEQPAAAAGLKISARPEPRNTVVSSGKSECSSAPAFAGVTQSYATPRLSGTLVAGSALRR